MARIETLYFIHHSHTDIGYTHLVPGTFAPDRDAANRFAAEAEQKAVVAPFVACQWASA